MGVSSRRAAAASEPRTGATAATKLRPPAAPASLLPRERLLGHLAAALERRLTTFVAEAGFGKSTLLAAWAAGVNSAWYTASSDDVSLPTFARGIADAVRLRVPALPIDAAGAITAASGPGAEEDDAARARGFVALVCETLQAELRRDLVLVVDDLQEIGDAAGPVQLIESLCRQAPERLHVVLASRADLPFPIERLRGQGQVLEITGSQLAFGGGETAALVDELAGPVEADVARELQRLTGGWPAAVRLAVGALSSAGPAAKGAALERMRRPGGPLLGYLAAEVFAHEPPEVATLVRTVAAVERFTAELCEELGISRAPELLESLARRGLFVELQGPTGGWYTLGAPVREFALTQLAPSEAELREVRVTAARWFEEQLAPDEALRCLSPSADAEETASLLVRHGGALLGRGAVEAVLDALTLLPPALRSPPLELLAGEAYQIRGDWDEALRCFERAGEHADPIPPALAWRTGLLLHLGGRLDEAVATYDRSSEDGEPRDVALLLAWRASAHWLKGDAEACRSDARRAFAVASAADDAQALAAAHTVLAMLAALEGDRGANDAHYLRALDYAQQAGDVLQVIRVRTNRGSRHVEECSYEEAISELDLALRLADLAGFAAFRALALTNRGEALAKLGRFEEAIADLEASRELYQRLASRMVAYPLEKLGEVYRMRGESTLARAAYEEALAQAEASGDLQGLVPSLTGLARIVVADDPDEAHRLAERALSLGPGMDHVDALLAAGWVSLARGERQAATRHAVDAAAEAGVRRDRAALAESLELRALAGRDQAQGLARLVEAGRLWRELGNPTGVERAELESALLAGDREAAARAEAALAELGARGYRAFLALVMPLEGPPLAIHSLGRFRVVRDGEAVSVAAWQSRKARDLLKMLVARRGRPTPRDALMEALWPGQSPGPLGNRLSVLLSTVRGVLDPERRFDQDHFVAADKNAIWLETENVALDVEEFLTRAREALDLHRAGAADSLSHLAAAERLYGGDFLEEDAYEEWAIALREEARTTYTELVRALAEAAARDSDADGATRYFLRVLERDAYDEPAHLGLVAVLQSSGRHGEARRHYRAYCARMDEIGIEPAPFPTALTPR